MPELPEGWEVFHMPLGLFCQRTHIAKMPRAPCLIHGSMSGFGQIWWLLCVPPQPIPLPGCCRSLELGAGSFSGRGTGWALPDTALGFPETPVPSQPWEQLAGSCSSPTQLPPPQCWCLSTSHSTPSFPPRSWSSLGSTSQESLAISSTFC